MKPSAVIRLFLSLTCLLGASAAAEFSPARAEFNPRPAEFSPRPAEFSPASLAYTFRRAWGGEAGQFKNPYGVAVTADGIVLAANTFLNRIEVIRPAERTFSTWSGFGYSPGQLNGPWGMAVDSSGNVYVGDSGNNYIEKFDASGNYLTRWGGLGSAPGQMRGTSNIAVDSGGNVYDADSQNNRIQKFTSTGSLLGVWTTFNAGSGYFSMPKGVAVDRANGSVFVADTNNNRIVKLDASGTYLAQWGGPGSADGLFNHPSAVAVDANSLVYVADTNNNRIQVFTSGGTWTATWGSLGSGRGQFNSPYGICAGKAPNGDPKIFVADSNNNRIQRLNMDGTYSISYESPAGTPGQFDFTNGMAVDTSAGGGGAVYAADTFNNRVQKFTPSGSFLAEWDGSASGTAFLHPFGAAVDPFSGNVYVVDTGNNRIVVFNSSGAYLTQWGSPGTGNYQFNSPWAAAVAGSSPRYVYVADTGNNRILKYTADGTWAATWDNSTLLAIPGFSEPSGIAAFADLLGNQHVFVADTNHHRILALDGAGNLITQWGSFGAGNSQMNYPHGLAVIGNFNGSATVYAADTYNDRVIIFDQSGGYLGQFGGAGSAAGQFMYLPALAVDALGSVYVGDGANQRIQEFTTTLPAADPTYGLALNGGFEQGAALPEWTVGGELPSAQVSDLKTEGSYAARLGQAVAPADQGTSRAWAYTNVYIPANWARPRLTFRYNITTNDLIYFTDFLVDVQDGAGLNHLRTVVQDSYNPCVPGPPVTQNLGWRSVTTDLTAYKGQYIRLTFASRNLYDNSQGIWTVVDDVRLLDAGAVLAAGPYALYLPLTAAYHCDP